MRTNAKQRGEKRMRVKRLLIAVLAFFMVTSVYSANVYADETDETITTRHHEVLDLEGNVLLTIADGLEPDILFMYQNYDAIVFVTTTESISRRGLDLTKTVVKEYQAHFSSGAVTGFTPPGDLDMSGSVRWKLRASITYNPNTYIITSATRPIRTFIHWTGWDQDLFPHTVNEMSYTPVIAPNKLSATFKYSMTVKADYIIVPGGSINYGSLVKSFTITP